MQWEHLNEFVKNALFCVASRLRLNKFENFSSLISLKKNKRKKVDKISSVHLFIYFIFQSCVVKPPESLPFSTLIFEREKERK